MEGVVVGALAVPPGLSRGQCCQAGHVQVYRQEESEGLHFRVQFQFKQVGVYFN